MHELFLIYSVHTMHNLLENTGHVLSNLELNFLANRLTNLIITLVILAHQGNR